jgi:hypothetical protein
MLGMLDYKRRLLVGDFWRIWPGEFLADNVCAPLGGLELLCGDGRGGRP